jgi:hypothetical protein
LPEEIVCAVQLRRLVWVYTLHGNKEKIMRMQSQSLYLTLLPGQPLAIAGGVGTEIRVLDGRVWLTEENLHDDIFLKSGQAYTLRTSGTTLLDVEKATRIVVDAPAPVRSTSGASRFLVNLGGALTKALHRTAALQKTSALVAHS